MPDEVPHSGETLASPKGDAMRIFIFKTDVNPNLGAFAGELAGLKLPGQFKPWRAVGAVAPDRDPPYNLSRAVIEAAITARGYQLFRIGKKD